MIASVPVLLLLTGCAGSPDSDSAVRIALAFHAAAAEGDGAAACALLAPSVVEDLEQSAGAGCPDAIMNELIPAASELLDAAAYGRNAQVVLDGDTVFLSIFDSGWRVIAAGCTPRDDHPYDCVIKGG